MNNFDIDGFIGALQLDEFDVFCSETYIALSMTGELLPAIKRLTQSHLENMASAPQKLITLSCAYINPLDDSHMESFLGELGKLEGKLKSKEKQIAIVRAPRNVQDLIHARMPQIGVFKTLPEAIRRLFKEYNPSREMEEFQKQTVEIFQMQFGITVRCLPVRRVEPSEVEMPNQVMGMIPLVSGRVTGNLLIRFSSDTIEKLGEQTFGKLLQLPDKDLLEVAGELANMILGRAKETLNKEGYGFMQTLPQLYYSTQAVPVNVKTGSPCWRSDFETILGTFSLDISLKDSDAKTQGAG